MQKAAMPKMDPKPEMPEITHHVYLDVEIDQTGADNTHGKIIIGLFGEVAPKSTENYLHLCRCDKGNGTFSEKPLCYKGSTFHRILPNFMIQAGDFTHNDGRGGESIWGGRYYEDAFDVKLNRRYLLAMADSGISGRNGSQFFINTVKTSWLDGEHVVFGMVVEGFELVDEIEKQGTNSGVPRRKVTIVDSGEM